MAASSHYDKAQELELECGRTFESRQWLYCRIKGAPAGDRVAGFEIEASHARIAMPLDRDQPAALLQLSEQRLRAYLDRATDDDNVVGRLAG